ncbi:glycosyltransferase family 4 protein [Luteimonas sp. Sa2BVA3]|uniref:Glycosyltransferase family 4 protein n=1 Tax=Luteimonas colneyensis TaxID=2762230 RepID=A0ABR8UIW4_9GAMM|nr:glycosyltransferase family 4 protein [Luteimonas colneyensis]MBD7987962.1 glycosyltransferase family 4 protein [Luteimonas colneyensis]
MRIAFLCKRRYMGKDVILDRYARLYEIPRQLARLGHEVRGYCLDYGRGAPGEWIHDGSPGTLHWESRPLGRLGLPGLLRYPASLLRRLRAFRPDMLVAASDIPHVALGRLLSDRLEVPYVVDLYDNFEGFGQARIPCFVPMLRWGTRGAALVTTTSEPLRQLVVNGYGLPGECVVTMPSSVDKAVFHRQDAIGARRKLGLPLDMPLIGTAGGLYRDKGIAALYAAWERIRSGRPDVHLVLAGPYRGELPPPRDERVHYLGEMAHNDVATLFSALDVGVISVLDTAFGRYCFPQKAYEMLACGLPVAAADVGAMSDLFRDCPTALFTADDPSGLADAVLRQLARPTTADIAVPDWAALVGSIEPSLRRLAAQRHLAVAT